MGSKVQLHLTSLGPENRAWRGVEAQGVRGWKMHLHEKSFWEVFAEEARRGLRGVAGRKGVAGEGLELRSSGDQLVLCATGLASW